MSVVNVGLSHSGPIGAEQKRSHFAPEVPSGGRAEAATGIPRMKAERPIFRQFRLNIPSPWLDLREVSGLRTTTECTPKWLRSRFTCTLVLRQPWPFHIWAVLGIARAHSRYDIGHRQGGFVRLVAHFEERRQICPGSVRSTQRTVGRINDQLATLQLSDARTALTITGRSRRPALA
jgi:hypothetical protein